MTPGAMELCCHTATKAIATTTPRDGALAKTNLYHFQLSLMQCNSQSPLTCTFSSSHLHNHFYHFTHMQRF